MYSGTMMLQSVVRQTYTNWELVLVDASDADKRLERRLPKSVPGTIVYEPIENGGIALNTTRGLALAHGEYITLLDHDDVLYPNALFEVVQTIQNTGADFVYSDEIVLSADLKELGGYHFKPDLRPTTCAGSTLSRIWRCSAVRCWTRRARMSRRSLTVRRTMI